MGSFESKLGENIPKYQEFIEYDAEGNPVVLRRSVSLQPEAETESTPQAPLTENSQESARPRWKLGSMKLFCDIQDVAAKLRPKLAQS